MCTRTVQCCASYEPKQGRKAARNARSHRGFSRNRLSPFARGFIERVCTGDGRACTYINTSPRSSTDTAAAGTARRFYLRKPRGPGTMARAPRAFLPSAVPPPFLFPRGVSVPFSPRVPFSVASSRDGPNPFTPNTGSRKPPPRRARGAGHRRSDLVRRLSFSLARRTRYANAYGHDAAWCHGRVVVHAVRAVRGETRA